jgi:hypothetical protein
MKIYIVTEGQFEADLLQALIPRLPETEVVLVPAGSMYSIHSMARSLLVQRGAPVAVVVDAHSVDEATIRERRQSSEEIIGMVAGRIPIRVVVAAPELETIFFEDEDLLQRVFGTLPLELRIRAEAQPAKVLEQLCATSQTVRNRFDLLAQLTQADIEILQETAPLKELLEFIEDARQSVAHTAAA